MTLYEDLKWRGLIDNISDEKLIDKLNNGGLTFYIGFDPTGDSLHIGHYSTVISVSKRLMAYGHKPILLAGGGTGLIGDPKPNAERKMISKEAVLHNIDSLTKQVRTILKDDDILLVNNAEWLLNMNAIDFLRDYGKHFNINYMLSKDTVKRRLDIGITYTEFSYMILQSIDFLNLYEKYGCNLQTGGSDQWGNITSGLELIRKIHGNDAEVYALTVPLVTKADGKKFGKTEDGKSIWLDKEKTTPYEMYQYFVNVEDSIVIDYLKKLTFLSREEIEQIEREFKKEPEKRLASKTLAYEIVKFIHGEEEAEKAKKTSEEVFEKGYASDNMPTQKIKLESEINILDLLVNISLVPSKSEARRLVMQGGIKLNGEVVDINKSLTKEDFENTLILSKGKKCYIKLEQE